MFFLFNFRFDLQKCQLISISLKLIISINAEKSLKMFEILDMQYQQKKGVSLLEIIFYLNFFEIMPHESLFKLYKSIIVSTIKYSPRHL